MSRPTTREVKPSRPEAKEKGKKPKADDSTAPHMRAKPEPIKLGFVVNDMATEQDNYTTIRLARVAIGRGHEVAMIGLGGFIYDADGTIRAMAHIPGKSSYPDDAALLAELQSDGADIHRISVEALDVLMLRSDPADEVEDRPWAPNSGLLFAQLAVLKHVIVVNDPGHLTDASNKTYFQHFPEEVRPVTCITLEAEEIRAFIAAHDGYGVIKPLQGSGGQSVFVVTPESEGNLNQMIDAVTRDGYAIVQEYLPKAVDGDLRLITLNGRPLCVDGVYACLRRYNDSGDARSNISVGGKTTMAQPDADALRLAEIVAPKLIRDGMYLAGLDIVGDKLMEINVDTPGGINMIDDVTGVDFSSYIIADLERKVRLREQYNRTLSNTELAVM
ncbi:glutathione synthase [soil metagenome]